MVHGHLFLPCSCGASAAWQEGTPANHSPQGTHRNPGSEVSARHTPSWLHKNENDEGFTCSSLRTICATKVLMKTISRYHSHILYGKCSSYTVCYVVDTSAWESEAQKIFYFRYSSDGLMPLQFAYTALLSNI